MHGGDAGVARRRYVMYVMSEAMSDIFSFTPDHVRRLTGLSEHQLRDWDRLSRAATAPEAPRPHAPYSRLYSFRDAVRLLALAELRKVHRVPVPELRKVNAALAECVDVPW